MVQCDEYEFYKFCVNNVFMLGDNSSELQNGLLQFDNYPTTIIIPKIVNDKEVQELGQNSLSRCYNLTKLIIKANIKVINHHALEQAKSLQYISLPSTLEII